MRRPRKSRIAIMKFEPEDEGGNGPQTKKNHDLTKKISKVNNKQSRGQARGRGEKSVSNLQKQKIIIKDESEFSVIEKLDEDRIIEREWVRVTGKTRWKCLRCGWCCQQEWRINLTWKEYDQIRKKLTITEIVVDEDTGMSHPVYTISRRCEKYDPKSHKCKIYRHRLYSCAAFPFILDDDGELLRSKHCKGFGSGDVVNQKKMKKHLKKWRKKAGLD